MRRVACIVVLSLLLVSLTATSFNVQPARAYIVTVPDDYATIQEAINHANEGDTVFLRNGAYYENVVVNKSISLIGEDREAVVIDGNWKGTVVKITAEGASLSGVTTQNAGGVSISAAVSVKNASNVKIYHNIFNNSGEDCVLLEYSGKVTLTDNIVIGHYGFDCGIEVGASHDCLIAHNDISGGKPIWFVNSSSNTIRDNVIFAKGYIGISIAMHSNNNVISGNSIFNSSWYGIATNYNSTGNMIFHNNFLNNTAQVDDTYWVNPNLWDNGCEGNFWSDYEGTDSNGDGIGDTPYVISEINRDNYPLMQPYWNPGDIDHDLDVDIFDIVRCADAYGSNPSSSNWDPHCDIAETFGVIDIFDIVMIAGSYGKSW